MIIVFLVLPSPSQLQTPSTIAVRLSACLIYGSFSLHPNATCLEPHIFPILDTLKPRAEGMDRLPAWFLRLLAPMCSGWISRLFNQSLGSSTIPEQWRVA